MAVPGVLDRLEQLLRHLLVALRQRLVEQSPTRAAPSRACQPSRSMPSAAAPRSATARPMAWMRPRVRPIRSSEPLASSSTRARRAARESRITQPVRDGTACRSPKRSGADHRQLGRRQLERESVLLEDLRVAPAPRPVELEHQRCRGRPSRSGRRGSHSCSARTAARHSRCRAPRHAASTASGDRPRTAGRRRRSSTGASPTQCRARHASARAAWLSSWLQSRHFP